MRKVDKKLDKQLRLLLTEVCETALKNVEGFVWLTHVVNFSNFPSSLKVICVFNENTALNQYLTSDSCHYISALIESLLKTAGINIKHIKHHVLYDTEENCNQQHQGNWAKRLKYSS